MTKYAEPSGSVPKSLMSMMFWWPIDVAACALLDEALDHVLVLGHVAAQHLERELLAEHRVRREVDDAHAALADLLLDSIATVDDLTEQWIDGRPRARHLLRHGSVVGAEFLALGILRAAGGAVAHLARGIVGGRQRAVQHARQATNRAARQSAGAASRGASAPSSGASAVAPSVIAPSGCPASGGGPASVSRHAPPTQASPSRHSPARVHGSPTPLLPRSLPHVSAPEINAANARIGTSRRRRERATRVPRLKRGTPCRTPRRTSRCRTP